MNNTLKDVVELSVKNPTFQKLKMYKNVHFEHVNSEKITKKIMANNK